MIQRQTRPVKLITSVLKAAHRPLTLLEITKIVTQQSPVAFSTVFRVMQKLEQGQKVRRVDWRERTARFEWVSGAHHHHITCLECGSIAELDDTAIKLNLAALANQTGYKIEDHQVELTGQCPNCRKEDKHGV